MHLLVHGCSRLQVPEQSMAWAQSQRAASEAARTGLPQLVDRRHSALLLEVQTTQGCRVCRCCRLQQITTDQAAHLRRLPPSEQSVCCSPQRQGRRRTAPQKAQHRRQWTLPSTSSHHSQGCLCRQPLPAARTGCSRQTLHRQQKVQRPGFKRTLSRAVTVEAWPLLAACISGGPPLSMSCFSIVPPNSCSR